MSKKVLLVIPLLFVFGCGYGDETSDESYDSTKTYSQDEIDRGDAASAQPMEGGGANRSEESED